MSVLSLRRSVPAWLSSLLLFTTPAFAQLDTGTIVGSVVDGSGAVLPGVTVTATQEDTNVSLTTVTNASGQFVFPALRVGRYSVAAEIQGFRRGVRRDITVNVQDRRNVDFVLEVGAIAEEVVVSARAELLQTQSADIGAVVDERQVRDLPLLGRRYAELALLAPGVVVAPAGITSRGEDTFFNANGNYATWNNYTLDGADNNSMSTNLQERSPQVVAPPVDALQEFKVQTRTYSAEFGKAAGAVINASVKQGSNQFRGTLFEFFRDEAMNANTWDNNRAGVKKGPFNQHIAGGVFGGPLVQGRTFFFGDYQATRTERALSQAATVPTARMRQGDLSELTGTMTASNPFVPAGCVDAAASRINPSCIDPVAARLIQLYPQPNVPGTGFFNNNFLSNGILNNDVDQFDVRLDHTLRAGRDQVFGRYSFQNTDRHEPPILNDPVASGDFASDIFNRGQSLVAGWSGVFGSSLFNEFRFGWNKVSSDSIHPAFGVDANARYGIRGVPNDPRFYGGLPHMPITRFARIGGPFFRPQFQWSQVFQFANNLTWNRGAHAMKFGIERRRDLVTYIDVRSLNGELNFPDGRYTGFGIGDFLLGLSSVQRLSLFHQPDLYADGWQLYGQDAWRVTPSLTVNYGIRYEYFTPMFDRNNLLTNIDPATGAIVTARDGSVRDRTLIEPDHNDIAPRVGVAWSVNPRLVLRAGYGVFYQQQDRYGSESQLGLNLPQLVDVAISATSAADPPAFRFSEGFTSISPGSVNKALVQWRIQDPNQQTPTVQQFSIGPEVQLGSTMVAAVEYVGNRTRHGRRLRNLNEGIIQTPGVGPVVFPYAQYGFGSAYLEQIVTNGRADYNALQTRISRRMNAGLAFTVGYTWNEALGDFLDHLSVGGGAVGNAPLTAYDMSRDYGPLAFDIPHRLVTSFIYELPWGRGRRSQPDGALGVIASDWVVNGILSLNAGRPFTVTATDRANTGPGRISRANCVGDAVPDGFDQTLDAWFDINAFRATDAFTYGTCGMNTVRGPGSKSMNLSIFRSVPIGTQRLEFRIETFNLFNWVNYGFPAASVSNLNTFGRITSTLGDPREIQLAVKYDSEARKHGRRGSTEARTEKHGRTETRRREAMKKLILASSVIALGLRVWAYDPLPQDTGAAGTWQKLLKLRTIGSVMHTTAHPDDEHGGLLAWLSRGVGARVSLMTLNRGQSGDNALGPQLFDGLGLIRTEELLNANQDDGVDAQYFTSVIDYGFSKRLEEALDKWGRENVLRDVVRIIRMERPFVLVSRFQGNQRDGHGNHQTAGLVTVEAFRAAGDANRFPEQIKEGLRPWQPLKVYIGGMREDEDWTVRVDPGQYSPWLGMSYSDFARTGLSFQRSQNSGRLSLSPGPQYGYYKRVDTMLQGAPAKEETFFDGIDTSLAGLFKALRKSEPSAAAERLRPIAQAIEEAVTAFSVKDPSSSVPALARGLTATRAAIDRFSSDPDAVFYLTRKEQEFIDAINTAMGVVLTAVAVPEGTTTPSGPGAGFAAPPVMGGVVAGQKFDVQWTFVSRGTPKVSGLASGLELGRGFAIAPAQNPGSTIGDPQPNQPVSRRFSVAVAPDAPLTSKPYFERGSFQDARYTLLDASQFGKPAADAAITARATYTVEGVQVNVRDAVRRREARLPFGYVMRELRVVPALSVTSSPSTVVVPLKAQTKKFAVQVEVLNNKESGSRGEVTLRVPQGWTVEPARAPFSFARGGERETYTFSVTVPSIADRDYSLQAVAVADGREYLEGYETIEYRDLETRQLYRKAATDVRGVDVQTVPGLKVGYVMGVGDHVPDGIRQLGYDVTLLDANELARGDLSRFDAIVTGTRAYAVREDLKTYNRRLLDWVERGGNLIVLYNTQELVPNQFAPKPGDLSSRAEEVSEEDSPVDILAPDVPMLNVPNKITKTDFDSWVEQRGSKFWSKWDPAYRPIIATWDRGQPPQQGGWLWMRHGKGHYTYFAYAMHRQLPYGVAGAYRLMANLLALGKAKN